MICLRHRIAAIVLVAISAATFGCGVGKHSAIPDRPETTLQDELVLKRPAPERFQLANGITVIYLYDAELPLVQGNLLYRGGSLNETPEQFGISRAMAGQMREGAIAGFAPDALDDRLDQLGAKIESSSGDEYGSVSFSSLSEDFPEVFRLFSKVIREPAFDENRFRLWQALALEGLTRRRDDPQLMTNIILSELMFGKKSALAGISTKQSISNITIDRMKEWHQRLVRPEGAILLVTGAVKRETLEQILHDGTTGEVPLAQWKVPAAELPQAAAPASPPKGGIYVLERDFDQASIAMAHLGPKRLSPDHYNISIFNRYFGTGSFGSLLFSEIRSRLGLAYAVDGGFQPGPISGTFEIGLGTRVPEALRAIDSVLELMERTRVSEPDASEIQKVKSSVERAFVFNFASTSAVASRAALLEALHYPKDYDDTYLPRLAQVGPKNVEDVAARLLDPKSLVIVITGKLKAVDVANHFKGRFPVYRVTFDTELGKVTRVK